jgi:hypothetical protein
MQVFVTECCSLNLQSYFSALYFYLKDTHNVRFFYNFKHLFYTQFQSSQCRLPIFPSMSFLLFWITVWMKSLVDFLSLTFFSYYIYKSCVCNKALFYIICLRVECEILPQTHVWGVWSPVVVLLWEILETLGDRLLPEEIGYWGSPLGYFVPASLSPIHHGIGESHTLITMTFCSVYGAK